MEAAPVEIDRDLVDLLEELRRPAKQAARELIVLELYRQGEVSRTALKLSLVRCSSVAVKMGHSRELLAFFRN
jgi:hypothetical protein